VQIDGQSMMQDLWEKNNSRQSDFFLAIYRSVQFLI